MMVEATIPKAAPGSYNSIAAQYARAKAIKDAEDAAKDKGMGPESKGKSKTAIERLNERKAGRFSREWGWVVGVFVWLLYVPQFPKYGEGDGGLMRRLHRFIHATGVYFFTKGFLLT